MSPTNEDLSIKVGTFINDVNVELRRRIQLVTNHISAVIFLEFPNSIFQKTKLFICFSNCYMQSVDTLNKIAFYKFFQQEMVTLLFLILLPKTSFLRRWKFENFNLFFLGTIILWMLTSKQIRHICLGLIVKTGS